MQNSFIHSVAHSKVAVKPYVYFLGFSLITANWEKNRGSKWEWFGNSLTHLVVSELWLIYKCIIFFLCQMWTSLGCIWRTSQKIKYPGKEHSESAWDIWMEQTKGRWGEVFRALSYPLVALCQQIQCVSVHSEASTCKIKTITTIG